MIDLAYPLRKGASRLDDLEIRYSLRSIEANLQLEVGRLFLYGHRPDWLRAAELVRMQDGIDKALNLQRKYAAMCADDRLSDPFLLLDDDHIFLAPTDDIRLRTCGTLAHHLEIHSGGNYGRNGRNALALLRAHRLPERNYQPHYPMLIHKPILRQVLEIAADAPVLMGSIYGNLAPDQPSVEVIKDFKLFHMSEFERLRAGPFVSLNNNTMRYGRVRGWLEGMFSIPGRWETATP